MNPGRRLRLVRTHPLHQVVYTAYTRDVVYRWLHGLLAILTDVEPYEVLQAIYATRRQLKPVHGPHGIPCYRIYARTDTGRPLVVTLRKEGGFDSRILDARPMTDDEHTQFAAWERTS